MSDAFDAFILSIEEDKDNKMQQLFGSSSSIKSLNDIMINSPNKKEKKKKSCIKSKIQMGRGASMSRSLTSTHSAC